MTKLRDVYIKEKLKLYLGVAPRASTLSTCDLKTRGLGIEGQHQVYGKLRPTKVGDMRLCFKTAKQRSVYNHT